ncbi:unnamed protein product [Protopolystoma xenopodis]|uniref:Uncharacterized protein n=1 Tax=Protopolystoma xenopodis TaxID=117903 RepID=A0A3S5CPY2_9PLAT|nr:unnamed protein product [Protopolystoma xenopodis]
MSGFRRLLYTTLSTILMKSEVSWILFRNFFPMTANVYPFISRLAVIDRPEYMYRKLQQSTGRLLRLRQAVAVAPEYQFSLIATLRQATVASLFLEEEANFATFPETDLLSCRQ